MITTAMAYKVIASRMSPPSPSLSLQSSHGNHHQQMECKECIERCPYELPIPDMLKEYYDLYEQHRAENCLAV